MGAPLPLGSTSFRSPEFSNLPTKLSELVRNQLDETTAPIRECDLRFSGDDFGIARVWQLSHDGEACCVWDGFDLNFNVVRASPKEHLSRLLTSRAHPVGVRLQRLSKSISTTVPARCFLRPSYNFETTRAALKNWVVSSGEWWRLPASAACCCRDNASVSK